MVGDLGLIDCPKLSAELENLTLLLREDTEARVTLGSLDGRGNSSEEKAFCKPHMRGPASLRDVSPTPSRLHCASCTMRLRPCCEVEASEISTGDSRMAQAQLSDSEGSHSADCVL